MEASERQEIYNRYKKGDSVRGIAKDYPYSLTFIQQLIKSFNYDEDIARNYPKVDGMDMYAICKKTGKEFYDYSNMGGSITIHVFKYYPEEKVNSVYKRKAREQSTGKFWYDDYFTFEYRTVKSLKKCFYCDWTTEDVENKSGAYTEHLRINHNKSVNEYLIDNSNDLEYFPSFYTDKPKDIECKICGERFHIINDKHLAKHGINVLEYKLKYGDENMISSRTMDLFKDRWINSMKDKKISKISSYEKDILQSIPEINFKCNDREILNGQEIDLYSEEHKIGIEINGLYYHSEITGKKDRNYHKNKMLIANQKGVKLIHIFEDEIYYKRDLVINKIKHIFNVGELIKIHARKCTLKINSESTHNFLEENHIQGKCNSNINVCAYYDDLLVAVMCLDNKRNLKRSDSHDSNNYELVRFSVKQGYLVNGIASKLLKYFIDQYNPYKIISFADRRWTIDKDNLYTRLGFKLVDISDANYWYVTSKKEHRSKRHHRFKFMKNKLGEMFPNIDINNKNEWEIMQEAGYDRIWDCGMFKYEMNIK